MVSIGKSAGKKCMAVITDMDIPLGTHIGNILEVQEAVGVLRGEVDNDLKEVCVELASNIVSLAKNIKISEAKKLANEAITSGKALSKLRELISAQGGDVSYIDDFSNMPVSSVKYEVRADSEGFIFHMDTERIGVSSVLLGAGREKKEDSIDYTAGIILKKKTGDFVSIGDVLCEFYTNDEARLPGAEKEFMSALKIGDTKPQKMPLIYKTVR